MEIDKERQITRRMSIAEDYQNGVPLDKICIDYGVSLAYVGKVRKDFNLTKRRPGASPEVRDAVAKDYEAGVKINDIALRHNVDRKTIWVIAKERGLEGRYSAKTTENSVAG
jgi:hypothetical protein